MSKEYDNPIQALAEGSLCNFQLPFSFQLPIPVILIPIPDLTIDLPEIDLECPLD